MPEPSPDVEAAAQRLLAATRDATPCAAVRDLLPEGSLDAAYAVQQRVDELTRDGRRLVGRKIGLTSAAVQGQFGVDRPDFGTLYADMAFGDDEPIPAGRLLQPRVEAEVAFVLAEDLPERPVILTDVLRATAFVVAAIEVVDSRIAGWDIGIVDTVADNASSGLFVLGGAPRRLVDLGDLRDLRMALTCDGALLSSGDGAACLGHPANAVVWLANEVASRGAPLRAGELVLSGSLGALVPVQAGRTYTADIAGLGSVRAVFAPG